MKNGKKLMNSIFKPIERNILLAYTSLEPTQKCCSKYLQNFHSNLNFTDGVDAFKKLSPRMEATHVMEVAQLLLSLIHSWGIDLHLDKVCETQLGLLRPMVTAIYYN